MRFRSVGEPVFCADEFGITVEVFDVPASDDHFHRLAINFHAVLFGVGFDICGHGNVVVEVNFVVMLESFHAVARDDGERVLL